MRPAAARLLRSVAACLAVAGLFPRPVLADTVTVFAAASLREALEAIARPWQSATGHRVVLVHAASSALARQIEAGAPADLFISADRDWADHLDKRGLLAPGTRTELLRNRLVLIAPAGSAVQVTLAPGQRLAPLLGGTRLAMGHPEAVPAGKYAKAALQALGAWEDVKDRIAAAESVRAALALVSRREAALGIVYRTDALVDRGVRVVDVFPAGSHPDILYPAARVAASRSGAAPAFLAHLQGEEARALWLRHGFLPAR